MAPDHTTLYRFYGEEHELLYVGISGNPGRRFSQHARDKPWWHLVAESTMEHFATRAEALEAERAAITSERPRYNMVHNHSRPAAPVRVVCARCDETITPGDGYIQVDQARAEAAAVGRRARSADGAGPTPVVDAYRAALDDIEAAHFGPVRWHALHTWCDTATTFGHLWWIGADRVSDWPGVLDFAMQASTEWWVDATNLHEVIYQLTHQSGDGPLRQGENA